MTGRLPASDALEAALCLAEAFEESQIAYCIGGAHALAQYSIPRATNDVDINVFVEPRGLKPVFAALINLGIEIDEQHLIAEAEDRGMFIVYLDGFRVDVFTPSIEYSWRAQQTMRRMTVDGKSVNFLSPEALCVFKLLFFRSKDLADLERIVAVMGSTLDAEAVRCAIVEMMGSDDPRSVTWDRLIHDFGK